MQNGKRQAEQAVRLYISNFKGKFTVGSAVQQNNKGLAVSDIASVVEEMRRLIRLKHFSYSTERTYINWAERFFKYIQETRGVHSGPPCTDDIKHYLSHLAIKQRISSSTQNQAFNALLFLFHNVLGMDMGDVGDTVRAKRGAKLPVVLTVDEIASLFGHMSGSNLLMAQVLYGAGLRLMELARLRVQDVDFGMSTITVRDGKGAKDRATLLPIAVKHDLIGHLDRVKQLHEQDLTAGNGEVHMPDALDRKYPNAGKAMEMAICFPIARSVSRSPQR